MRSLGALGLAVLLATVAGCAGGPPLLSPIGAVALAADAAGPGVTLGGISGIDRDPATGAWMLISDDRSDHGPARVHEAALDWRRGRLAGVRILRTIPLRDAEGRAFPPATARPGEVVDPESVRFDPLDDAMIWSSEGDMEGGFGPSIRRMGRDGRATGTLPLPPMFAFDPAGAAGSRPNLTVEGLAWTPDGRGLWVAMEGPLRQDSPLPDRARGARLRLTLLDRAGAVRAQRAYDADPLADAPPGRRADSGVSEVLALDAGRLLVLERAGVETATGDFRYRVRLYCADVAGGTEIAALPALAGVPVRPAAKRRVLELPARVSDNFEGLAWGPALADGRPTLVLVSDNNFSPGRPTRLAAFALNGPDWPSRACPR